MNSTEACGDNDVDRAMDGFNGVESGDGEYLGWFVYWFLEYLD